MITLELQLQVMQAKKEAFNVARHVKLHEIVKRASPGTQRYSAAFCAIQTAGKTHAKSTKDILYPKLQEYIGQLPKVILDNYQRRKRKSGDGDVPLIPPKKPRGAPFAASVASTAPSVRFELASAPAIFSLIRSSHFFFVFSEHLLAGRPKKSTFSPLLQLSKPPCAHYRAVFSVRVQKLSCRIDAARAACALAKKKLDSWDVARKFIESSRPNSMHSSLHALPSLAKFAPFSRLKFFWAAPPTRAPIAEPPA
jgi:hypothetical protein